MATKKKTSSAQLAARANFIKMVKGKKKTHGVKKAGMLYGDGEVKGR